MDDLKFVRQQLAKSDGQMVEIAKLMGFSYDTILRIKSGEGDPGYSKVRRLAIYFRKKLMSGKQK